MASFIKVQPRVTPRWNSRHRRPHSPPRARREAGPGCWRLGCPAVDQVKLANQLTRKAGGEGKAGRGRAVSLVSPVLRYRGP